MSWARSQSRKSSIADCRSRPCDLETLGRRSDKLNATEIHTLVASNVVCAIATIRMLPPVVQNSFSAPSAWQTPETSVGS